MADRELYKPQATVNRANVVAPVLPTAEIHVAEQFAGQMADLNNTVSDRLTRITLSDAEKAGAVAGTSPGFKPRDNTTLANTAYNRAAERSYFLQTETQTRRALDDLAAAHPADPGGLEKAITAYQMGVEGSISPDFPEALADVRSIISIHSQPLIRNAKTNFRAAQQEQAGADLFEGLEAVNNSAERLARLSDFDDTAAADLALEREKYRSMLAAHGPAEAFEFSGQTFDADPTRITLFSPMDMAKKLDDFDDNLEGQRILAGFDHADNKEAYLAQFVETAQTPGKSPLSLDQVTSLSATMAGQLRSLKAAQDAMKAELGRSVTDAEYVLERGKTPAGIDSLRHQARLYPDLAARLDAAVQDRALAGEYSRLSPVAQQTIIASLQQGDTGTRRSVEQQERLTRIHDRTLTGLKNDPVAYANEVGVTQTAPIDLSKPETLRARQGTADLLKSNYGIDSHGLTRDEADTIKRQIASADAQSKVALSSQLSAGLDDNRLELLMDDIGGDDPMFTAAALLAKDAPGLSERILYGQGTIKTAGKVVTPPVARTQAAINDTLGAALINNPTMQQQASEAAMALEVWDRAQRGELSAGAESFDEDRYSQYLNQVVGGVLEHNGGRFIAPRRGMDQETFEGVMERLNDDDVRADGLLPKTLDGEFVSAAMIRDDGALESIGNGVYLVRYADGYLLNGTTGKPYQFDLGARLPQIQARPR
mgnify:CR=1 FL=1